MKTFHVLVLDAVVKASSKSLYNLSRAQEEAAIQPVLDYTRALPDPWAFIRASFKPGSYSALALEMFKRP